MALVFLLLGCVYLTHQRFHPRARGAYSQLSIIPTKAADAWALLLQTHEFCICDGTSSNMVLELGTSIPMTATYGICWTWPLKNLVYEERHCTHSFPSRLSTTTPHGIPRGAGIRMGEMESHCMHAYGGWWAHIYYVRIEAQI